MLVIDVGTSGVRAAIVHPTPPSPTCTTGRCCRRRRYPTSSSSTPPPSRPRCSTSPAPRSPPAAPSSRSAWPTSGRRRSCGTGPPASRLVPASAGRTCARWVPASLHGRRLRVAPNVSATKLAFLLDLPDPDRARDLCFGTVDTWVVWTLSGGRCTSPTCPTRRLTGCSSATARGGAGTPRRPEHPGARPALDRRLLGPVRAEASALDGSSPLSTPTKPFGTDSQSLSQKWSGARKRGLAPEAQRRCLSPFSGRSGCGKGTDTSETTEPVPFPHPRSLLGQLSESVPKVERSPENGDWLRSAAQVPVPLFRAERVWKGDRHLGRPRSQSPFHTHEAFWDRLSESVPKVERSPENGDWLRSAAEVPVPLFRAERVWKGDRHLGRPRSQSPFHTHEAFGDRLSESVPKVERSPENGDWLRSAAEVPVPLFRAERVWKGDRHLGRPRSQSPFHTHEAFWDRLYVGVPPGDTSRAPISGPIRIECL